MKNLCNPQPTVYFLLTALAAASVINVSGAVHYVNRGNASPAAPYTSWSTAATNIQDAVDAAVSGEQILVTNGIYNTGGRIAPASGTSRVVVTNAIVLQSIDGPSATIIVGGGQTNGVSLGDGAVLIGFTLTNGPGSSLGAVGQSYGIGGTLSNCVLSGSVLLGSGGLLGPPSGTGAKFCTLNNCLIYSNSLGADYCSLNNCVVSNNVPFGGVSHSTLNACVLVGNRQGAVAGTPRNGGGAGGSFLTNCILNNNIAYGLGSAAAGSFLVNCAMTNNGVNLLPVSGGDAAVYQCTLSNCILASNPHGAASGSRLDNCLLVSNLFYAVSGQLNTVSNNGANNCIMIGNEKGAIGLSLLNNCSLIGNGTGAEVSILNNCTVVSSTNVGTAGCSNYNCILYYNAGGNYADYTNGPYIATGTLSFCCTTPRPADGFGNITNEPAFMELAAGNLRLRSTSPCINAGNNFMAPAPPGFSQSPATLVHPLGPDLDNNPRIAGGSVDMGAYEFQLPTSIISYAWLMEHGLPNDGSADHADPDGDHFDNWQESRAGTSPTDPASFLRILNVAPDPGGNYAVITWQSVPGLPYFLERGTNLARPFDLIDANANLGNNLPPYVLGAPGTNVTGYVDYFAQGAGPFFYRIVVQ